MDGLQNTSNESDILTQALCNYAGNRKMAAVSGEMVVFQGPVFHD